MRGESSSPDLAAGGRCMPPQTALRATRVLHCRISDFPENVHFGLFQQYPPSVVTRNVGFLAQRVQDSFKLLDGGLAALQLRARSLQKRLLRASSGSASSRRRWSSAASSTSHASCRSRFRGERHVGRDGRAPWRALGDRSGRQDDRSKLTSALRYAKQVSPLQDRGKLAPGSASRWRRKRRSSS